ncbi:MAG TPA: DUF6364 family protein [Tepidisphaeraceae bacterium]|jgi:hypothetical protein|nr:DUF6364 family protein [Tepidisphaeraceae bacterium]
MAKNVTLRLDDAILQKARHEAVQQNRSLSQWLADLILQAVSRDSDFTSAKRRAIKRLKKGLDLGGKPLTRDEIYAERIRLR